MADIKSLYVPASLHDRLKVHAVKNKFRLSKLAESILRDAMDRSDLKPVDAALKKLKGKKV